MPRRTDFQAAKTYTGQKLKGLFNISYKIDGVRILYRDEQFKTRNDKIPLGLQLALSDCAKNKIAAFGDCEVYKGSFFESNGPLTQLSPDRGCITANDCYPLDYECNGDKHLVDDRLHICNVRDPEPDYIEEMLAIAVHRGYEGLIIRNDKHWYRVKPSATADVIITGWFEQQDAKKNPKGQLGGFTTNYGRVTAFSDADRKLLWENPDQYIGQMMTVTYKERYHTGKFRYCVTFNHFRTDKSEESFDTEPPLK